MRYLDEYHCREKRAASDLATRVQHTGSPTDLLSAALKTNDLEAARAAIDQEASISYTDILANVLTQEMFALLDDNYEDLRVNLLRVAVKFSKLENLERLWTFDPPFEYVTPCTTILHEACHYENSVVLHFLLNYCPPEGHLPPKHYINARNERNHTPLMVACVRDPSYACVRLLLDHGADRDAATSSGATALRYAQGNNKTELIAMLTQPPPPKPEENCTIQ